MLYGTTKESNMQFRIQTNAEINADNIKSAFVLLEKFINQGVTTGDKNIDNLICVQGKIYREQGINSIASSPIVVKSSSSPQSIESEKNSDEYVTAEWMTNCFNEIKAIVEKN